MGCGSSTHEPGSPSAAQGAPPVAGPAASSSSKQQHAESKDNGHHAATSASSAGTPTAASNGHGHGGTSHRDSARKHASDDAGGGGGKPHKSKSSRGGKVSTEDRYEIIKVLGEGASCKVVSARDKQSSQLYAMKIMDKAESYNKVLWENETLILQTLRHPNILEWVESYEDKKTFHLLTVLCQGGELFDRVKNGSFSEKVASRLAKEMIQALEYCHQHSICHRDLKPENFVFENSKEDSNMKLIDFGCAKVAQDDEVINDVAGSPYYCAPEVLSESYVRTGKVWKAADMWSVGVIIFLLVCGYPPFNGDSQERIFKKIKRGKFRFPKSSENGGVSLSESVKSLITELLQMQPKDRLTAADALKHPWICGDAAPDAPLPSAVVDALGAFRSKMRLKKAVARVLAHHMTEDDKDSLAVVFKKFDVNGDGQLGAEEIAEMMRHIGSKDGEGDAVRLMESMDDDADGGVSMDEFATHVTMGQLGKDKAQIKATFDMFDLDHDGFITHKEIEKVCDFLTPEATQALIKEVDANNDGKINFAEWLSAMTDIDITKKSGQNTPAGPGTSSIKSPQAMAAVTAVAQHAAQAVAASAAAQQQQQQQQQQAEPAAATQ